jgi:cytochrome c oxidase subunit 3
VTTPQLALAPIEEEHSPVATLPHDTGGGIANPVLGMLLFIVSEIMFFAGLFAAYFSVRALAPVWPPPDIQAEGFSINPLIVLATGCLVTSSFFAQSGVRAIRRGDRTVFLRAFAITLGLGITFLALEFTDWTLLYSEGITMSSGTFGTTYFTMTGFHFAHVVGGVVMLSVVLYRGMLGQFSPAHHDMVEATDLYWHFVDIVWILLVITLYLLPGA